MPDRNLVELFDRYIAGTATPAEIKTLMEWLDQPENEIEAQRLMEAGWEKFQSTRNVFDVATSARMLEKIQRTSPEREEGAKPGRLIRLARSFTVGRVAAVLFVLLAAGGLYVATRPSSGKQPDTITQTVNQPVIKDIPPGTDGAILTLADGRKIVLDSAGNGELTRQGNTAIVKQGGRLSYTRVGPSAQTLFNTLLVPRGRQYQLILPDGSHVWLNAASSIRYPAAFTGKDRKVEITGEAYFEVAPDALHPFRVRAGEAEVDVLGTHFNIMAYEEENALQTTLLEGAVKVTRAGASNLLQPGQQAQLVKNTTGIVVVDDAPINEAVAWKNGLFFFNRASLQTVMRQIARWYDVSVIYEENIPTMEFGGKIARNNNISEVLKILELSKVHFRIEDKKIIVMP